MRAPRIAPLKKAPPQNAPKSGKKKKNAPLSFFATTPTNLTTSKIAKDISWEKFSTGRNSRRWENLGEFRRIALYLSEYSAFSHI